MRVGSSPFRRTKKKDMTVGHVFETVEKVAQPLFRGGLHESFVSISCEIVGEAFARSVISEVHAPGNDDIAFYSVAFGQRNSLQEGFFDKLKDMTVGHVFLFGFRSRWSLHPSVFQCSGADGSVVSRNFRKLVCSFWDE